MGTPLHFKGSTSSQGEPSMENRALSLIAETLHHPDRTLLSVFVQQAYSREDAARFFLSEVSQNNVTVPEFLSEWIHLLKKVRPSVCIDINESLREYILQRDGGGCCLSRAPAKRDRLLPVFIVPPTLIQDIDTDNNGKLYRMLTSYIGDSQLQTLRPYMSQDALVSERYSSEQLMTLTPRMFEHFRNGRNSLKSITSRASSDSYFLASRSFLPSDDVETLRSIKFDHQAGDLASPPNAQLLDFHHRFADALAWLEVSDYMTETREQTPRASSSIFARFAKSASVILRHRLFLQSISHFFLGLWLRTPMFFRALVYIQLISIGKRLYGDTISDRMHRLPFNLYLRKSPRDWAPKHQAEFQAMRLIKRYTVIPVPTAIDVVKSHDSSFLLMTRLPGDIVGHRLNTMTDDQLQGVAEDLKRYTTEMRNIPNHTASGFQICNALGGGILDWRIGNSQREELKFQDEIEFNKYLTKDLPPNAAWDLLSKSHEIQHDIVFTHADLNPRNILIDDKGKISGIVDWECAGWYPEYWELTKAHFAIRHTRRWILDVIDQVFPNYRNELTAEDHLSDLVPPW